MYKNGAGYSERRQIMSPSFSSRTYDTMNGIKINIVQVRASDLMCSSAATTPANCPNVASLTTLEQTGTILIPDGVTTILNLMTGMGLLGVAAVVSIARSSASPFQPTRTSDCQRFGRICPAHHPKPMRVSLHRALHCAPHSF
jgi:hypothetical protein